MKYLIIQLLCIIILSIVYFLAHELKSYLETKQNNIYAKEALKIVQAVENELGNGNGGTKLKTAVARLIIQFSDLTEPEAYEIVNKAWYYAFDHTSKPDSIISNAQPATTPPAIDNTPPTTPPVS